MKVMKLEISLTEKNQLLESINLKFVGSPCYPVPKTNEAMKTQLRRGCSGPPIALFFVLRKKKKEPSNAVAPAPQSPAGPQIIVVQDK
ncbi:unnamed protein product [Caenorhabditis nigoni]